jgi:hypothetical protein
MRGAIHPLPQYVFMAWCLVKHRDNCRDKVKVKLSLCFNYAKRHEGLLGEWRYNSTHSLTSALDGGEWSASPKRKEPLVPIG